MYARDGSDTCDIVGSKLALRVWLICVICACVLVSVQFSHMHGTERDQCEAGAAATHPRISCSLGR